MILLKMPVKVFESKITETKNFNDDVKCIGFHLPEGFNFKPGQYLSLSTFVDGKKLRKPYSIVSLPGKKFAEFCIKLVENGKASHFIKNLKEGNVIELFGPAGKFFINENSKNKDLIFISAGTGISSFISMISYLLENEFENKIILLKGFKDENEILYEEEFLGLKKRYKNFEFYNILSQPNNNGFENKGYVQDFLNKYIPQNFQGDFYICGLNEMIDSVVKKLKEKGVTERKIFFEKYN